MATASAATPTRNRAAQGKEEMAGKEAGGFEEGIFEHPSDQRERYRRQNISVEVEGSREEQTPKRS